MGSFRRMILLLALLTFLGGFGAGTWVGRLAAAPRPAPRSVDGRVADFERILELDGAQVRRLRQLIAQHDLAVRAIQTEMSEEQFRRKLRTEEATRERIREILTEGQRSKYDRLLGRD